MLGQTQPCAGGMRNVDALGHGFAILESDHWASPLLKIDSTSSAAV